MAGYFAMGTLAAFGALCLVWALLGWLLPDAKGCVLVCTGVPDEGTLSRWRWLHSLGLLRCPLVAVTDQQLPEYWEAEICSGEDLLLRLERERERFHGTGNGDSPRRGQRCGISEL